MPYILLTSPYICVSGGECKGSKFNQHRSESSQEESSVLERLPASRASFLFRLCFLKNTLRPSRRQER